MEELSAWELLEELRGVKMTQPDRLRVAAIRKHHKEHYGATVDMTVTLRSMCRKYARKIKETKAARERARISMAWEKRGKSYAQAQRFLAEEQDRRLATLDDQGI